MERRFGDLLHALDGDPAALLDSEWMVRRFELDEGAPADLSRMDER